MSAPGGAWPRKGYSEDAQRAKAALMEVCGARGLPVEPWAGGLRVSRVWWVGVGGARTPKGGDLATLVGPPAHALTLKRPPSIHADAADIMLTRGETYATPAELIAAIEAGAPAVEAGAPAPQPLKLKRREPKPTGGPRRSPVAQWVADGRTAPVRAARRVLAAWAEAADIGATRKGAYLEFKLRHKRTTVSADWPDAIVVSMWMTAIPRADTYDFDSAEAAVNFLRGLAIVPAGHYSNWPPDYYNAPVQFRQMDEFAERMRVEGPSPASRIADDLAGMALGPVHPSHIMRDRYRAWTFRPHSLSCRLRGNVPNEVDTKGYPTTIADSKTGPIAWVKDFCGREVARGSVTSAADVLALIPCKIDPWPLGEAEPAGPTPAEAQPRPVAEVVDSGKPQRAEAGRSERAEWLDRWRAYLAEERPATASRRKGAAVDRDRATIHVPPADAPMHRHHTGDYAGQVLANGQPVDQAGGRARDPVPSRFVAFLWLHGCGTRVMALITDMSKSAVGRRLHELVNGGPGMVAEQGAAILDEWGST